MGQKAGDFSVNSKGYCFLCLNKISSKQFPPTVELDDIRDIPSSSVHSLQDVSRYLKIDMRKVFIQGGAIPPPLLARVERANLKVELCDGCASVTTKISKQCRQLEKLKMEIESGLEFIQEKMLEADETGRAEKFRRDTAPDSLSSGMGDWIEILEVLRTDTNQKCFNKISTVSPRLQIQKLTTKTIHRRTIRILKNGGDNTLEQIPDSEQRDSIKIEEPAILNWAAEDDDSKNENSFADGLHSDVQEWDSGSSSAVVKHGDVEDELTRAQRVNTEAMEPKWTLNPTTGKYKCQLCTLKYGSKMGVHHHYNKVHRKIRIRCKLCGKEFTQQGSYKVHHESVHLGVRFQCKVCKRSFSQKGKLMAHQRSVRCAVSRKTKS